MQMLAMVIDDSRTARLVIGNMLRELGMEVISAANGVEGIAQLSKNPDVELILLDWNMPEMNGLDFLRTVRSQMAYQHIRILMATSEAHTNQVNEALKAGASEYLMKPFNKDILVAKLNLLDVIPE
jgi:two-component system chemotaxis response regulator CheY